MNKPKERAFGTRSANTEDFSRRLSAADTPFPFEGRDAEHELLLRGARPDVEWEVTNQATVHVWHWKARGALIPRHQSLQAGIASWPETATAVAVRLAPDDRVDILAPLGLEDLFALRLRHNPAQVGAEVFWQRVAEKRWLLRWPDLNLVVPSSH